MNKNKTQHPLVKVITIQHLYGLAIADKRYERLAMISASNLGGNPKDLRDAIGWLNTNAMETDEQGVVDEINFCRDLV